MNTDSNMQDFGRWILTFDPGEPSVEGFSSVMDAMLAYVTPIKPVPVPWPAQWAPVPQPLTPAPNESDALPQADVLIVTWTAGEARTMSALWTGDNLSQWYEYRNNVDAFIPLVTGPKAPFNSTDPKDQRYYHSLGLYYPVRFGSVRVLAFKSGLHMAYDGPAVPVVALWKQIISEVKPQLVITTGTGGGIGADVLLGDVVIAEQVRFDLTAYLKNKPFAQTGYNASSLDNAAVRKLIDPSLIKPNGDLLSTPRIPVMLYPDVPNCTIVSTDSFAFDDSSNHYNLQGLGKCCDMGDAALGLAISDIAKTGQAPQWHAIRNASDPQIPNPSGDFGQAQASARAIYNQYQMVTTAGSLVASWATAIANFPGKAAAVPADLAVEPAERDASAPTDLAVVTPASDTLAQRLLLLLATSRELRRSTLSDVPAPVERAIEDRLTGQSIQLSTANVKADQLSFTDGAGGEHHLYYAEVTSTDSGFAGTYVVNNGTVVAAFEAAKPPR